jgi:predicted  nucleic acid-binding Zn-ribbon protein
MSDTDDLLDELEQLENASAEMQEEVEKASEKNKALEASGEADHLDAAALSLEAAKTAQLAAEQSQSAAEAAIKISHEQKAQIIELSDSNVAWRQSLRAASNDLKTAKNAITIMMSVSIAVSVISVGIMSWLYYSLSKKHDALKGDVLDIITTENTLFNKNLNLKVDQLSSLIEALAADIQRLNIPRTDGASISASKPAPEASANTDTKPEATQESVTNEVSQETQTATKEPKTVSESVTPASGAMMKAVQKDLKHYADERAQQYAGIQALLQKIQDVQAKIEASTLHKTTQSAVAPVEVTSMGLTESQVKKLNGISWSVSEQRKLLKKIQATLDAQMKASSSKTKGTSDTGALKNIDSSLKQLSKQVTELKSQQDHIQKKVQDLETVTQELASRPNPYSYRAPELNIKE